ncbi:MAG: hypothetical protein CJD30_11145, partial [Sulfuricurvum sp. PD_MW2]|uniref:O-antigen ligase family protein n=1 Tax=Sulfuricurvum sp. PD_MW2 TaxID=2027917 RepID=UPI000C067931
NLFILLGSILIYIKFIRNIISKNYKNASLLFLLFCLMGISLFLEKEVTSRLISLVWLIAIIFVTFNQIHSKLRLIIAVGIVLLSISYITNSNRFQKGFSEIKNVYVNNKFEGSWGHRLKLAEYGIKMWLENPIIGRGIVDPVDKMREQKKINPNDFKDPTVHFHNQLILILVQVGLLGFTLFLSFFYYFYNLKIKNTEINLFKQTTLLVYFLVMFGEHYLHMIYTSTFFALLIGLFFAYKNQEAIKN